MDKRPKDKVSLRSVVYEYLKGQINSHSIRPGSFLDLTRISEEIGLSRTPLRDALFQLEFEGFVTIYPRKGVLVNVLTLKHIRDIYEIIGALESSCLISVSIKIEREHIARMQEHNDAMQHYLEQDQFDVYYEHNVHFHNVFLELSDNEALLESARILRERLYDFPRNPGFLKDWESSNLAEHREMMLMLQQGDFNGAANYLRDVHWSFAVQERFIRRYYAAQKTYFESEDA